MRASDEAKHARNEAARGGNRAEMRHSVAHPRIAELLSAAYGVSRVASMSLIVL